MDARKCTPYSLREPDDRNTLTGFYRSQSLDFPHFSPSFLDSCSAVLEAGPCNRVSVGVRKRGNGDDLQGC